VATEFITVYIMASENRAIYTGVTSRLFKRAPRHKNGTYGGFSARYKTCKLVYFERLPNAAEAFRREKQIKGWRREKKTALIERGNPEWLDLFPTLDVFDGNQMDPPSTRPPS
jgi:putative endonuclease